MEPDNKFAKPLVKEEPMEQEDGEQEKEQEKENNPFQVNFLVI